MLCHCGQPIKHIPAHLEDACPMQCSTCSDRTTEEVTLLAPSSCKPELKCSRCGASYPLTSYAGGYDPDKAVCQSCRAKKNPYRGGRKKAKVLLPPAPEKVNPFRERAKERGAI